MYESRPTMKGKIAVVLALVAVGGLVLLALPRQGGDHAAQTIGGAGAGGDETPAQGIIRVSEIKPGMKGYGLSVFEGTKIEKFDVEVVSVLKKYFGDKDIIMVRTKHPMTDHANIIHGMSGSPIYIDGKLAGALALGFAGFPKDPLAGITPIEYMLADKDHPWEDEEAFIPPLPKDAPFQYCRTPLMVSGVPPAAFSQLKQFFGPLGYEVFAGSAGAMELEEDIKLEPGSSVGISFMRGDINMDGIGTVTYVNGNDVLVFGHPMMMGGQMDVPMTTAYVHTVIAELSSSSYKLASAIKSVGSIRQDRLTSVYGVLGQNPPMIPMTVTVENAQTKYKRTFTFEVARHPTYTPYLVSAVPDYCVTIAEAGQGKDATVSYDVRLKFEGYPEVQLKDRYVTSAMGYSTGANFDQTLYQLMGNAFKKVRLEKVDIALSVVHRKTSATIEGAWIDEREVKPGATLDLAIRLRPYNKDAQTVSLKLPLPESLPDGEYALTILGGRDAAGAMDMQQMMQMIFSGRAPRMGSDAQSFEELLAQVRRRQPSNRVVAQLALPTLGVRHRDQKLENLPGSVFANLVSNAAAGLKIEEDRLEIAHETEWLIEGRKTVKFEVKTPGQARPPQQQAGAENR